ncbi:MAG: hypothetical protein NTZ74_10550 [Chloroflexi bacterium]|nr:hypothetical protein [Chloroflexota bacterium]
MLIKDDENPLSLDMGSVRLTNNTGSTAVQTISCTSANAWVVSNCLTPITVLTGNYVDFEIYVSVPGDATAGQNEITTINIVSDVGVDPHTSFIVKLTTTAISPVISGRPLVAVNSYTTGSKPARAGQEFELSLILENRGQLSAWNVVATFDGTGFFLAIQAAFNRLAISNQEGGSPSYRLF